MPLEPAPLSPTIAGQRLVTADHVCRAVEATLASHLPSWTAALDGYADVTQWLQLPTLDAISSAATPVGGIVCPGLTDAPIRRAASYDATFRVVAAVYDRGADHDDTQYRARTWAALMRTVLRQHPTLGGLAALAVWTGEEFSSISDRRAARTLGAASVTFDITVRDVVPTGAPLAPPDGLSVVTSVHPAVSATTTTIHRSSP